MTESRCRMPANSLALVTLAALLALTAGCGQTGPLVLPGANPAPSAEPAQDEEEDDEARQ